MNPLDELVEAESEVLDDIVETYTSPTGRERLDDKFDNRPTWDNWGNKTSKPFDQRPTWDNWDKRKK